MLLTEQAPAGPVRSREERIATAPLSLSAKAGDAARSLSGSWCLFPESRGRADHSPFGARSAARAMVKKRWPWSPRALFKSESQSSHSSSLLAAPPFLPVGTLLAVQDDLDNARWTGSPSSIAAQQASSITS